MECVEVCDDDALRPCARPTSPSRSCASTGTSGSTCPPRRSKYIRVDDLEEGIGALETILLDKANYLAFTSGDGACLGCAEKTVIHLFTATVEALMQPRIAKHLEHLGELIARLEKHVQLKLVRDIDVGDPAAMARSSTTSATRRHAGRHRRAHGAASGGQPIDQDWLRRMTG